MQNTFKKICLFFYFPYWWPGSGEKIISKKNPGKPGFFSSLKKKTIC